MSDEHKEVDGKSDELTDGALIVIGPAVYFIPRDDLRSFKVPVAVAAEARARLKERMELTRGHPNDPVILGAQLTISGPIVQFSSFVEHCLTASRLC